MPTHYHFLIYVKDELSSDNGTKDIQSLDISKAMMKFSVSYTKAINHKYDRVGPLFQGSFQSKYINSFDYYWQVINYIHENPVESNLVEDPTEWLYSSIHDYYGKDKFGLITIDLGGSDNLGGPANLGGPDNLGGLSA
jgi:hypothetical protein